MSEILSLCGCMHNTGEQMEQYYLQDNRSYVGNDILWWAKDGRGYTTDLSKAHVYTKDEAISQHQSRETDIPWPKEYVDQKTRPTVDMQYVRIKEALKGTGVKLIKPKPPQKNVCNCHGCGRFLSEFDAYNGCPKCGADNSH